MPGHKQRAARKNMPDFFSKQWGLEKIDAVRAWDINTRSDVVILKKQKKC